MTQDIQKIAVLKALAKKKLSWDPLRLMHARQRFVFKHPAKLKCLCLGRRWGKSMYCAIDCIDTCVRKPGAKCLYIGVSLDRVKDYVWREIKTLINEYFPDAYTHDSMALVRFANGSQLRLSGCPNRAAVDDFRGTFYDLVVVDEAKDIPDLQRLIQESLGPTLAQGGGRITMIGTPDVVPAGFFYECFAGITEQDGTLNTHGFQPLGPWDLGDNTYLIAQRSQAEGREMTPQDIFDEDCKKFNLSPTSARFLREYKGIWASDDKDLVFHWNEQINEFKGLPSLQTLTRDEFEDLGATPIPGLDIIIGMDTGHSDADAICVVGYDRRRPAPEGRNIYVLEEFTKRKQGWDALGQQLLDTIKRWSTPTKMKFDNGQEMMVKNNIAAIVCDFSQNAPKFAQDWSARIRAATQTNVTITAADKHDKDDWVRLFDDEIRAGIVKISKSITPQLVDEMGKVTWRRSASVLGVTLKATGGIHSDILDAVLYAWRKSMHWRAQKKEVPASAPTWGQPGYKEFKIADRMRRL